MVHPRFQTWEPVIPPEEPPSPDVASIIEVLASLYPNVPIVELARQVTEVLEQGRNLVLPGM
jgi:hypothetical protein